MPKITYKNINFRDNTLKIIAAAEVVIDEYMAQGYKLTLRQLYYQFVARGWLANQQREYERLGTIISDARLAGLIDWEAIEDRSRFVRSLSHWDDPAEIISMAAQQFRKDKWEHQKHYVEVWIEKDALVGVIEQVCNNFDVPFLSCRGYVSQSEMWVAAQRLIGNYRPGKRFCTIVHLGDHDPSGIDMTRDIEERLRLFGVSLSVERVALNMDQVQQYNPPPNPAKMTDSRFNDYWAKYGDKSWELDALEPAVLEQIIKDTIDPLIDLSDWKATEDQEKDGREQLDKISQQWDDIIENL